MVQLVAHWIRGSATAFYFGYYVKDSFGDFLALGSFAGICGMIVAPWLRKWMGSTLVMILATALVALSHNRSATGLVFAAASLSQKIGGAIGGAIPAWCLFFFGFVQPSNGDRQIQSEETLNGIVAMMSLIPAVFLVLSAVVMLFYPLSRTFLQQIQTELKQRKKDVVTS